MAYDPAATNDRTRRLATGVFLLSGSLLALEMLYVRLVSILLYPVATYLVISLALLGMGAGGTYLSLRRRPSFNPSTAAAAALGFAVSVVLSLVVLWYAGTSWAATLALPIFLSLPMFFGGIALSLALALPGVRVQTLYAADLAGAGLAAGLVILGLNCVTGIQMGLLIAGAGTVAGSMFLQHRIGKTAALGAIPLLIAAVLAGRLPNGISPIAPKELGLMLRNRPDVQWEFQRWSPLARVDVLSLPGDLLSPRLPVAYKLVTHDGGAPTLLISLEGDDAAALVEGTIFGVPYWFHDDATVLVIGLGGGPDVLAALAAGASRVVGAEVNPQMIALVRDHYASFVNDPYSDPRVALHLADGRHLLARSDDQYDVIQLTGVDTTVASIGANPNLAENYLYTREAFGEYLDHLSPTGTLSVSFPNVDGLGLRLLALASDALRSRGVSSVERHVIVAEMTGFIHVLVNRREFTPEEVAVVASHFEASPTSIYFPLYHRLFGIPDEDFISFSGILLAPGVATHNEYADFIQAVNAGAEAAFLASQPQNLDLPTDNRPFFFVLDKWGGPTPNFDMLILTLTALSLASALLILLPPSILSRRGLPFRRPLLVALYFACLGLSYIFVEVTFIQKLALLVGHPSYSLAITLCALLASSGAGSLWSDRLRMSDARRAQVFTLIVAALVILAGTALELFSSRIVALPLGVRLIAGAIVVAIPGFFMGIPFPSGLASVKETEPRYAPWAWGTNAVFTVVGTVLALLLAISQGFRSVLLLASALYLAAGLSLRAFQAGGNDQLSATRSTALIP